MTDYLIVGLAAFAVSGLTLFSGFGLGTLLMPVFALLFPMPVAVAQTAVVHGANNLFKVGLLGRSAPRVVLLRFGLPAVLAAFGGALLLGRLARGEVLASWHLGERLCQLTPLGLVLGGLVLLFASLELVPAFGRWRVPPRWLPLGGLLSGFFGGLSGHQGALRAAFLTPLGLSPEAFAGTQAVIACMVDVARLIVYGTVLKGALDTELDWTLVGFACVCAFTGAFVGRRLMKKVTVGAVRKLTGVLLLVVGAALVSGLT
ncbi:MAG: sulfite exporter TauE/SafE family protein [Planctomycetota bacterium]|nr:MAG: sulfite exporter TauE/SafE family protein [Planctomycetota bacterium]